MEIFVQFALELGHYLKMSESDDSDYIVEQYIRPKTCSVPLVNDESADLLGNFDDSKRNTAENDPDNNSNENPFADDEIRANGEEDELQSKDESDESEVDETSGRKVKTKKSSKIYDGKISQDQIASLLRGSSKSNRFVIYVTNLNFGTSKERLMEYFSTCGNVKCVRIPKKRKGGFAFVEMTDVDGFKVKLIYHFNNTNLISLPFHLSYRMHFHYTTPC